MMWEAYNVILEAHPFAEAHRRMSDYVVAGLLLTPPDATYTEGRDAILAAAGALDTDDMILMAAAFAGRGAGTCAISPPSQSFFLEGVVESGTIAARIATSPVSVSDDGASCDHDGYLDPGETGTLRITLANSGVIGAEGTVVTATTTTPGITLGKPVVVGTMAALSQVVVAIPGQDGAHRADQHGPRDQREGRQRRPLRYGPHRDPVPPAGGRRRGGPPWRPATPWRPSCSRGRRPDRVAPASGAAPPRSPATTRCSGSTRRSSPTPRWCRRCSSVGPNPFVVSFKHAYDQESDSFGDFFDGGVIELSSDGGLTWRDVTTFGANPGYTGTVSLGGGNPIEGRSAYAGRSAGFPARQTVTLNFGTQFAGKLVQLRFRAGSDSCCSTASGWTVDDVSVSGITNTPFPGYVAEPTRCTALAPSSVASSDGVIAVHLMPRHSLAGVPGASDPQ